MLMYKFPYYLHSFLKLCLQLLANNLRSSETHVHIPSKDHSLLCGYRWTVGNKYNTN